MSNVYSDNQIFVGYPLTELDLLRMYMHETPAKERGFHKDVFGNKARLEFFFNNSGDGFLQEDIPFPDNGQYGEAIEYLGTLRGVQAAGQNLVVYELGAGFAPWLIVAHGFWSQRNDALHAKFVAVEADPNRLPLIALNFRDNGLPGPGEHDSKIDTVIVNAAVADEGGELYFSAQSILDWGGSLSAEAAGSDYRGLSANTVAVPARKIDDLISDERRVDLLHIDIQGWEAKSIAASIDAISEKVACMVIGTHSRVIEGDLIQFLRSDRWVLLYEKPCKFDCNIRLPDLTGSTLFDGTQVWINTALWPADFDWTKK